MNKREIVKAFNPTLDEKSLDLVEKLSISELNTLKGLDLLHNVEKYIIDGTASIKNRVEELNTKINTSLFGNKKFINESYAFEIPLNEKYFISPERVQFKKNILTTKLSPDGTKKKIDLNATNITSRRNTDFKLIDKILTIEKNEEHSYQELEIHLPKNISSGYLYIEFDKYDNISILNKFGRELVDKTITNKINQIISKDSQSIILRFHTNKNKSFIIKNFYVTEESFSLVSEIETKPIRIGYRLNQIGINTCDNYSESSINIDYQISINGKEYRQIRPVNKQKNLDLNSILTVDTEEHYYELKDYSIIHDEMLFHTTEFEVPDINITKSFNFKLGVDEGLIRGRDIHLKTYKDEYIVLHKDDTLSLNGATIVSPEDNYKLKLTKGFNVLSVPQLLLKESENFMNKSHIRISSDYDTMTYINTLDGLEYNKLIDFNPNIKDKNSLIYQLITKGDIFLEPVKTEKKSINNVLYVKKENRLKNLHLFVKSKSLRVETVQLKIRLESANKDNPAYISSLTIRGV